VALINNTLYYWRVQAKNVGGANGFTNAWSFSTGELVTDIDGNVYQTVKIGNQVWTVENLRTTRYNDGTPIPNIIDYTTWSNLSTPAYCYYNNTTNADYIEKWGTLYNWNTANTGKLAPAGWHVPTDSEWKVMQSYLVMQGYNYIAISLAPQMVRATETVTGSPGKNSALNNSSGFSALPDGYRWYNGNFIGMRSCVYWWSATEDDVSSAYGCNLYYDNSNLNWLIFDKFSCGFSVRLVRD
jgi:uncharacterized protein (TIGR02145 family)